MEDRESLIRSDSHAFNIFVEAKNSKKFNDVSQLKSSRSFGPEGKFVFCDFEMALAAPRGRDIRVFNGFLMACAVMHAINGQLDYSKNMIAQLMRCGRATSLL
uniref:Protein kinase domain-containing protein n=1 Tax=Odontella aurita TaxID=265563 RepID=A0A7S4MWC7_9STRA|mmetsp:Transcript_36635/g.110050  ORF Transcript_36635/g.110050 Transcript_36635/m.110050 type:complete len:103 (+) Transcript_36635:986-1294(+)